MKIIKKTLLKDGVELCLTKKEGTSWQGFVLTGLPTKYSQHEQTPQSISSAVMIWNRVVCKSECLTVKEVSAKIRGTGVQH